MTTIQPLDIIIVEKNASLKLLCIKDFKEEELYKKCGFKKADDFTKQTEWKVKIDGNKYLVQVYAKNEGRANNENKYDFPPPIDTKLFFGNCAIIAKTETSEKNYQHVNISLYLWNKIYEKLFGGFEDLAATAEEDENEIDELENVAKEKKTKSGYLKDGFVVDDKEIDDLDDVGSEVDDDYEDESDYDDTDTEVDNKEDDKTDLDLELEECGSELSEEDYDYSLYEEDENKEKYDDEDDELSDENDKEKVK
jgi:hypothetical protein